MPLITPTFDGLALWGLAVSMRVLANPPALQPRGVSGLNGLFLQTLGSRGRTVEVQGVLRGVNQVALEAAEQLIRDYQMGQVPATLFTTSGATLESCLVVEFTPLGEIEVDLDAFASREYSARLLCPS